MDWFQYPLTHGYITTHISTDWDSPHYAVDIATPFHTAITAVKPGKVVQADYAAWGGEVFIKPDDGSTEYYYYHLDQNDVSTGQHVSAGQVVGLSGGQNTGGSHPVSTQWSSGPHTHIGYFTNWVNTPIGTRPYGPDITTFINNLKTGKQNPTGSSNISDQQQPTSDVNPISLLQLPNLEDVKAGATSVLVRMGLFLILFLFILGGIYILFKDQIHSGVKLAAKVALV